MVIRDRIFSTLTNVFKRHGAVTIDTSVDPTFDTGRVCHGLTPVQSRL